MTNTSKRKYAFFAVSVIALLVACSGGGGSSSGSSSSSSTATPVGTNPTTPVAPPPPADIGESTLMFVTSVPSGSFDHQLNTFGNHLPVAPPGGDLYLRYANGDLRNLTKEADYGVDSGGIQGGPKAIAVRQPTMHWGGEKAIFSMQVGGPTKAYEVVTNRYWQMYEVTNLGKDQKAAITLVPDQPADYNNVSPIYGSDDQILVTSDKPLYGMTHTYPQLDEYESTAVVSGIWKLNPVTGKVTMIEHAPSGVFDLHMDSYGRVLFTKWDHLKRDQQADLDRYGHPTNCAIVSTNTYGPFDFLDEKVGAVRTAFKKFVSGTSGKRLADNKGVLYDVFPEARHDCDPTRDPNEPLLDFNQFMIWQINEDGSEEEVINHAGRNEFGGSYMYGMFKDDPLLQEGRANEGTFSKNQVVRETVHADSGIFQLREDVKVPGRYHGTYAQEFKRQSAGRIFEFDLPPPKNPEEMVVTDYTNASLDESPYDGDTKLASQTGHYRDSLKLFSDAWVVSHTSEYRLNSDDGGDPNSAPAISKPRYVFQIKNFVPKTAGSSEYVAGTSLTKGIVKKVIYWTGVANSTTYDGPLNETDVIEVRPRTRPPTRSMKIDPIEKAVLNEPAVNVDETELRKWLTDNNLALIVTRNMTIRDRADTAQPFNLRVPGGVENIPSPTNPITPQSPNGTPAKVYDIQDLQIFQGDLTRAYDTKGGVGRRVFSKPMHNSEQQKKLTLQNLPNTGAVAGSVKIGADGSTAAFVPAGRALTWQVTDPAGKPVIRERNWLTFAPGEIRTCASCHGLNSLSHDGSTTEPKNSPQALRDLMAHWKNIKGL